MAEEVDPDDPDAGLSKHEKQMKMREKWVRGFDHVLPIDYKMGNYKGPIEKLVELLEVGDVVECKKTGAELKKLDPNARDRALNLTPLMKAAARGYLEAIDCLLDHGADPDLKDNVGMTALHKCWKTFPDCKARLIERGATQFPWPQSAR